MKKLLTILFFIPIVSFTQTKPIAGIEYCYNKGFIVDGTEYKYAPIKSICGVEYAYKNFSTQIYSEVYMDLGKTVFFKPRLSEYTFQLKYSINKDITVKCKHVCIHPIINRNEQRMKMFGGENTIGIYYNFNK